MVVLNIIMWEIAFGVSRRLQKRLCLLRQVGHPYHWRWSSRKEVCQTSNVPGNPGQEKWFMLLAVTEANILWPCFLSQLKTTTATRGQKIWRGWIWCHMSQKYRDSSRIFLELSSQVQVKRQIKQTHWVVNAPIYSSQVVSLASQQELRLGQKGFQIAKLDLKSDQVLCSEQAKVSRC